MLKKLVPNVTLFKYFLKIRNYFVNKHSEKLNPYLFQNDVALYFEVYWRQENAADISFRCFIKLKD